VSVVAVGRELTAELPLLLLFRHVLVENLRKLASGGPCLGMHRHELNDAEWARIEPLLPAETGRRGRPADLRNRTFMNAIFYVAKTGAPWRDLPERFGPWHTIHNKFTRWNRKGVFRQILDEFRKDADHDSNMADGSYSKAHQDAAGGKGGPKFSVLDALAEVSPPRSTLSWTVSVVPSTSISRRETSTTSAKRRRS
jgi:transposase